MRLLIVTQAVDTKHPVLGFFHRWIEEFAERCESVVVICLYAGAYALPKNVRVFSLGKEKRPQHALVYAVRFLRLVWNLRHEYDAVFVHMNVEYVLLAGFLWRALRKRVCLWYLHRTVSWKLKAAVVLAHVVCTGTKESLRLESPKIHIMGQGVDIAAFSGVAHNNPTQFTAVFVGRLSPIKRVETLIDAVAILVSEGLDVRVRIVGGAESEDQKKYEASLHKRVREQNLENRVEFAGAVPHAQVPEQLKDASVMVNTSMTGSLDKAGIEPMAMGIPVVSCNDSYRSMLEPHGLWYEGGDTGKLAGILMRLARDPSRAARIGEDLKKVALENHDLARLVPRIINLLAREEKDALPSRDLPSA